MAGAVIHVDHFGNLITSVRAEAVEALGPEVVIHVGGRTLPLVGTYGDLPEDGAGALIGSHRRLEIAVREGRAESLLGATRGAPVLVSRSSARSLEEPLGAAAAGVAEGVVAVLDCSPDGFSQKASAGATLLGLASLLSVPPFSDSASLLVGATLLGLGFLSVPSFSAAGFLSVPPFSDSRAFLRAADG